MSQPEITRDASSLDTTAGAPPFIESVGHPRTPSVPWHLVGMPIEGDRLDDFEILERLGSGAFACVFLARHLSLRRLVALKITRTQGREAQTLARLEHPHIVAIYSETSDASRDLHVLCMQFVPGTTLERVMQRWQEFPLELRHGQSFLECLERCSRHEVPLDLAALRDRERLATLDGVETVCWLGARLAEALAHAHQSGVLHRDVKPANVLINRYGRPLLADFNVSHRSDENTDTIGGTVAYMAPEHLEAFLHPESVRVDHRADLFSLGVVLFELYTGKLPFVAQRGAERGDWNPLIEQRRAGAEPLSTYRPAPASLERILARCLAADPAGRPAHAAELAQELDSCLELNRVRGSLPEPRPLTRWALSAPFWFVVLAIPLPHLLATVVNIAYNATRLQLSDPQLEWFPLLVVVYNSLAYPILLGIFLRKVWLVHRTWRAVQHGLAPADVPQRRREALQLPGWLAGLSALGWLPGGLLFPLVLSVVAPPVPPLLFAQFLVSFTLSGLIAITYSAGLMELLVVRVLYPSLFVETRDLHRLARSELRHVSGRLAMLQFLAMLIPAAGASLMLGVGPEHSTASSYQAFRILVTATLAAGMVGLGLAVYLAAEVRETVGRLTGQPS
jgi:serine/threonine protein kinase